MVGVVHMLGMGRCGNSGAGGDGKSWVGGNSATASRRLNATSLVSDGVGGGGLIVLNVEGILSGNGVIDASGQPGQLKGSAGNNGAWAWATASGGGGGGVVYVSGVEENCNIVTKAAGGGGGPASYYNSSWKRSASTSSSSGGDGSVCKGVTIGGTFVEQR